MKYIPLQPIIDTIGSPTYALSRFLVDKLKSFTGQTQYFIKDSSDFIHKNRDLHLDDHDLMVSFDVVSLFTKITIPEALNIISQFVQRKPFILLNFVSPLLFSISKVNSMNKLKALPWDLVYPMLLPTYLWNTLKQ